MTPAWLGYFGSQKMPFSKEVADAELWLIDELRDALRNKASARTNNKASMAKRWREAKSAARCQRC